QMLQKVRITDPGDTDYLEGEHVDRSEFREANKKVIARGGTPARSEPLLLGITQASLTTQSFVSAASFQETTRVLTDAAVRGAKEELTGLKENLSVGHLSRAWTGVYRCHGIEFLVDQGPVSEPEEEPVGREAEVPGGGVVREEGKAA